MSAIWDKVVHHLPRSVWILVAWIAAAGLLTGLLSFLQYYSARAVPISVGLVLDSPNMDISTWGWELVQGLERAEIELGVTGEVYTSTTYEDLEANIIQCAESGKDLCIGGSFLAGEPISAAAQIYTQTLFATFDYSYTTYTSNLRGVRFDERQIGYLAGTLAGMMSESSIVGGVGGSPVPAVVDFLESYTFGAKCATPSANAVITYTNTFTDPDLGAQVAQAMIAQGADVIFSAAGPTGNGAILTATQSGVWGIGIDTDQYVTLFLSGTVEGSEHLLSSAMKNLADVMFWTIEDAVNGEFSPGTITYGLAEDGVGLAPFHEAEPAVSAEVRARLEMVRLGIIDGWVKLDGTCPTIRTVYLPFTVVTGSP